jgi:hypothetical protein
VLGEFFLCWFAVVTSMTVATELAGTSYPHRTNNKNQSADAAD